MQLNFAKLIRHNYYDCSKQNKSLPPSYRTAMAMKRLSNLVMITITIIQKQISNASKVKENNVLYELGSQWQSMMLLECMFFVVILIYHEVANSYSSLGWGDCCNKLWHKVNLCKLLTRLPPTLRNRNALFENSTLQNKTQINLCLIYRCLLYLLVANTILFAYVCFFSWISQKLLFFTCDC